MERAQPSGEHLLYQSDLTLAAIPPVSGDSIATIQLEADEFADREYLVTAYASPAESEPAAHQVAVGASSHTQVALLTRGTLIDGLSDQLALAAEHDGHLSEGGASGPAATQTVSSLPAALAAVAASSDRIEVVAADGTDESGPAVVTRIVTDGDRAHAVTACCSMVASARSSLPST